MAKRASTAPSRARKRRGTVKKPAPKRAAAKTAAQKTVARKTAPKKAAARRPIAKRPGAKRSGVKPRQAVRAVPSQRFTVSHLREEDFRTDGLRPYARYRDLGIAAATGGLARAHVIRMIPPVTAAVRQRHLHNVDLQLVYVLKGWMKNEFEGHGVQMMEAGSCWLQPPGIPHTVLEYSDDLEVLEIIVPADFKTLAAT